MSHQGMDLDDMVEDIFDEVERVQDGTHSHTITMAADSPEQAARALADRLVPFFKSKFYPSDERGWRT